MMKNLVILIPAIIVGTCSCKTKSFADHFYDIIVTNKSPSSIRVLLADKYAEKQYPDTSLPLSRPSLQEIAPGKSGYFDSKIPWEENLEKLPADTLSVYFIDAERYNKESWDSIRIHYKVLKRLDLGIEDLQKRNYTIFYP